MLVVKRSPGKAILIGDDIKVVILDVTAQSVRIGIEAPQSVRILRAERRLVEDQNAEAARPITPDLLQAVRLRLGGAPAPVPNAAPSEKPTS